MTGIQELRRWLGEHRALGTRIMQEGIDITDADAVAPWQDRMQAWCHSLISAVEKHDQSEAGRFEPLVRITHSNFLPQPMNPDHQNFWRCHFERLIRLDDFLARLNKRYGIAGDTPAPREQPKIPEAVVARRLPTQQDAETAYAAHVAKTREETGRKPTAGQDETWRKDKGISRRRVRTLRAASRSEEEKKGGAPKKH